jgi:hypothetical protein
MEVSVVGFIPPVQGVDKEFNTFRLGSALFKRLKIGDTVFLMDEKTKIVFGTAQVTRMESGLLGALCDEHAATNHREVGSEEAGASQRLFSYIQRIYGPHIATVTKKATVIFMRRIE